MMRALFAVTALGSASAHSSLLIPTSRNALIDRGLTEFDGGKVGGRAHSFPSPRKHNRRYTLGQTAQGSRSSCSPSSLLRNAYLY